MTEPTCSPSPSRPTLFRRFYCWLRSALALTGLLFIIYHAAFDLSPVISPSMQPTLRGDGKAVGDWVLAEKISYRLRAPRRWELVSFRNKDGLIVAKRVVGLPGESICIKDNHAAINGAALAYPPSLVALRHLPYGSLRSGQSASCGSGYFVLGDDSKDSLDSRFEGTVARAEIRARPWLIVWPLSRWGLVNP